MSPESSDKPQPQQQQVPLQNMSNRPAEPENLPCPRCESTKTKFCYYNNYNLSQPRYFCKSCRRYWTRGGTLRNVPVGGGTRKPNKRSRTSSPSSLTAAPSTSSTSSTVTTNDLAPVKLVKPENGHWSGLGSSFCGTVNLNETAAENFESFFKAQQQQGFPLMPVGYFGFGSGIGVGSGFGTWDWSVEQVGKGGGGGGNVDVDVDVDVNVMSEEASTWQLGCGGEGGGGLGEGDYIGWSDLAISAPGHSLKWKNSRSK